MTSGPRVERLQASRQKSTEAALQRVQEALEEMKRTLVPLTAAELARKAQVSRSFLYRHPELVTALEAAQARRALTLAGKVKSEDRVTSLSLKADLEVGRADNKRLREQLAVATRRLAEVRGQEVLAAVPTEDWEGRAKAAETEVVDLRSTNRRLQEDLEAARERTRSLTKQLNGKSP